jgi:hypothetical protein
MKSEGEVNEKILSFKVQCHIKLEGIKAKQSVSFLALNALSVGFISPRYNMQKTNACSVKACLVSLQTQYQLHKRTRSEPFPIH